MNTLLPSNRASPAASSLDLSKSMHEQPQYVQEMFGDRASTRSRGHSVGAQSGTHSVQSARLEQGEGKSTWDPDDPYTQSRDNVARW